MKLYIAEDTVLPLSSTLVMGILDIRSDGDLSPEDYVDQALSMQESGAQMLEVGLISSSSVQDESDFLLPVIEMLYTKSYMHIAVHTRFPEIMEKAVALGAQMIIDPSALREEGALETVARLNVPVCLVFDCNKSFECSDDPVSHVSEFLYERIDACLNAGISKKKIVIDPSLGLRAPIEARLKLFGRISTFASFGLPVCIAVPRALPQEDCFMYENQSVSTAISLFLASKGVHIIRTKLVQETVLALDTWDSVEHSSKPFRLTKAIASKILRRKTKEQIRT
ncbi:dihydropteroate synthase [Anaerobiospirillum thomasii]|uniref:Dihydropteroate synthase n=1 Tax=Anaerobiospirillum thomasii TaxID=179995 RepID=A0A2X0V6C1_9GAMM|nr:dihydropteroate synthase [Anaerobiospirillum thomasii]SPT69994.1 Dihydropteroate synthase [Anaerobiospirillum thomasii]